MSTVSHGQVVKFLTQIGLRRRDSWQGMRVLIDSNCPLQPLLAPPTSTRSPGALYKLRSDHSYPSCALCCKECFPQHCSLLSLTCLPDFLACPGTCFILARLSDGHWTVAGTCYCSQLCSACAVTCASWFVLLNRAALFFQHPAAGLLPPR